MRIMDRNKISLQYNLKAWRIYWINFKYFEPTRNVQRCPWFCFVLNNGFFKGRFLSFFISFYVGVCTVTCPIKVSISSQSRVKLEFNWIRAQLRRRMRDDARSELRRDQWSVTECRPPHHYHDHHDPVTQTSLHRQEKPDTGGCQLVNTTLTQPGKSVQKYKRRVYIRTITLTPVFIEFKW